MRASRTVARNEMKNAEDEMLLIFADMRRPVRFVDCSDLLEHLSLVFPGWSILQTLQHSQPAVLTIRRRENEYEISGDWIQQPLIRHDKVAAICALVAELVRAHVNQDDRLLCLHGAAAEFAGKLVVFPSYYRAGKSLLTACLAAAGMRVFCDDVLPLSLAEGEGIAPGLAPRLRLPLPDNLSEETRQYIEARRQLSSSNYTYLDLGNEALAARGWRLPIGAFVLLERQAGVEAQLEAASEADILRQVVWQNFAREAEAPRILEVLNRLVQQAACYRLRYDRAEEAVELLRRTFRRWPDEPSRQSPAAEQARTASGAHGNLAAGCYLRQAGISMLQSGDQSFLADRDGAAIYHLNPIGSAIWSLLQDPMSIADIAALLLTAFPELEPARVKQDVRQLCRDMEARNLLLYGGD